MALSVRADNIILVLYAPGADGEVNEGVNGPSHLEQLIFLLAAERKIWLPSGQRFFYSFRRSRSGPFSAELYDELLSLHAMGCVRFEEGGTVSVAESRNLRRYFGTLENGADVQHGLGLADGSPLVTLDGEIGLRAGKSLFSERTDAERSYLCEFKARYNAMSPAALLDHVNQRYFSRG